MASEGGFSKPNSGNDENIIGDPTSSDMFQESGNSASFHNAPKELISSFEQFKPTTNIGNDSNNSELSEVTDDDSCKNSTFGNSSELKETIVIKKEFEIYNDSPQNSDQSTFECESEVKPNLTETISKDTINETTKLKEENTKNKIPDYSIFSTFNFSDCFREQNITICSPGMSSSINCFKTGVVCSSTPIHVRNMKGHIKNNVDNLSVIKEENEDNNTTNEAIIEPQIKLTQEIAECSNQNNLNVRGHEDCSNDILDVNASDNILSLSILRKDELSLLIDLPNKTVLKKEENLEHTQLNLTLRVKNNESVVYKNIIDKTLDDILIEDGELISIKELNNLDTESDKKEIFRKATALKEFISSDDNENKDNFDPEWELLKKLETDDERYKAVRQIWRNLAIPDLKKNLSTLNWRKANSLPIIKNVEQVKTDEISKKKKNCTYDCTEVFDVGIQKLTDFYVRQCCGERFHSIAAPLHKKPRMDMKYNLPLDIKQLETCVQERLNRHDEAKLEIQAVHQFYNGLKNHENVGSGNTMKIDHTERRNILDIENMIDQYTNWYKEKPAKN